MALDRLPAIGAVIRNLQPDVVAILEANNRTRAEQLAQELGMRLVFGEANCAAHIGWLTRIPVHYWENYHPDSLAKTLLEIVIDWDGQPLHLFATHLGSRWEVPKPVTEIPIILDRLRRLGDLPHLLVGDFNALAPHDPVGIPPHGQQMRGDAIDGSPRLAIGALQEAGYMECYRALHAREAGYTYLATHRWLRLDYIFASPQVAIHLAACDVDEAMATRSASDHLPIWASFH